MMITLALAFAAQWMPPTTAAPQVVTVVQSPLPPGLRAVRVPLTKAPLQQLITQEDYPASALARREEGRVGLALDIGVNGRVTMCTITRTSGSRALDSATCRLVHSRAKFTPAMDSTGAPRAGRVEGAVVWRLPVA